MVFFQAAKTMTSSGQSKNDAKGRASLLEHFELHLRSSAVQMDGHCCIQDLNLNQFYGRIFKWIKHQTLVIWWDLGSSLPQEAFFAMNCWKTSQPPAWHCCCRVCTHLRPRDLRPVKSRMPHVSAWSQDFKKGKQSRPVKQNALCNDLFLHGCLQESNRTSGALPEVCGIFSEKGLGKDHHLQVEQVFCSTWKWAFYDVSICTRSWTWAKFVKFDAFAKDMWLYEHVTCELLLKYWRLVVWKQARRTTKYSHNPERLDRWSVKDM